MSIRIINSARILVFILPFVFIPTVFNPYEFPKFVLFTVSVFLLFSFFLLLLLKHKEGFSFRFDFFSILVLIFGFSVFISDIVGIDPKISLLGSMWRNQGFLTLLTGILLFILIRFFRKPPEEFLDMLVASSFLLSIIAFLRGPLYQGRLIGTLGNPDFLGGYLAMLLPFILFLKGNNKIFSLGKVCLLILVLFTIAQTGSRSALFAAIIVFFIYALSYIKKLNRIQKFSAILIGAFFILATISSYRLLETYRTSIWDNRTLIWTEGIKAFEKRPILGYGQENFELIFPSERHMKVDSAHNIFLEIAVSSGIIGLVLFVSIFAYSLYKASILIRLSLLAFLICASFNPISIAQICLMWFLVGSSDFSSKNFT